MSLTKTYIAANVFEAVKTAKAELGEDCLIVSQRKIKVGGNFFGFGGRVMVEVEVRVETTQPPVTDKIKILRQQIYQPPVETPQPPPMQQTIANTYAAPRPAPAPVPVKDEAASALYKIILEMKEQINSLSSKINRPAPPPPPALVPTPQAGSRNVYPHNLQKIYDILCRAEFSEPITNKIMLDLQSIPESSKEDWELLKEHFKQKLSAVFKTIPQITLIDRPDTPADAERGKMPKLVAFVGTTGVGKTTTLAKIATNFVLRSKKKVVLLTIDTYRVAATHQITVYADIIGVPCEIVFKESDFLPCIQKHLDADIILIDTAGHSQRNNLEVLELRKFLYPGNNIDIETFLVISSTIKYRDMQDIVKSFSKVNFNKLIFTKTDETTTWGPMVSLAAETGKPMVYLSNGQNVPDDIMQADSSYILKKIIDSED